MRAQDPGEIRRVRERVTTTGWHVVGSKVMVEIDECRSWHVTSQVLRVRGSTG